MENRDDAGTYARDTLGMLTVTRWFVKCGSVISLADPAQSRKVMAMSFAENLRPVENYEMGPPAAF